jgi:hypothetical protein
MTDDLVWVSASEIAKEYNRSPRMMRIWCTSGFFIELGFSVRRDETGHWIIGVPQSTYQSFKTKPEIAEPTI